MELGSRRHRQHDIQGSAPVILLDTNALVWLLAGRARAKPLLRFSQRHVVSPVVLLELRFLEESGRVRIHGHVSKIEEDPRLVLDDPSSAALFEKACELSWTRDPFDRLVVAHAQLRGWRLATADRTILEHLGVRHTVEL
jgi:PIN domain nuclease of toxin-antitoxin system